MRKIYTWKLDFIKEIIEAKNDGLEVPEFEFDKLEMLSLSYLLLPLKYLLCTSVLQKMVQVWFFLCLINSFGNSQTPPKKYVAITSMKSRTKFGVLAIKIVFRVNVVAMICKPISNTDRQSKKWKQGATVSLLKMGVVVSAFRYRSYIYVCNF